MKPEEIELAMQLAMNIARQSALRATTKAAKKDQSETTRVMLDLRVAKAKDALRNYLKQFQTVSTAHTTQGEK